MMDDLIKRMEITAKAERKLASLFQPETAMLIEEASAEIIALRAGNARLREALEPFANPPAYVFMGNAKFVPANMPDDWIGGGWFGTDDFKKARAALSQDGGA